MDAWVSMVDDWLTHRDNGHSVLMLATERATVAELNRLARAHLAARGDIARRARTYRAPDDRRTITLAVELDAAHRTPDGPASASLPAAYVGTHVDYGYARTVDTAQGATVDHSLFTPSSSTGAERANVALSRGRLTNRIYATRDQTWIDALGRARSHALAVDQSPAIARTIHRTIQRRSATPDQERHSPFELDL